MYSSIEKSRVTIKTNKFPKDWWRPIMPDRDQELQAITLFIESFRIMYGVTLAIRSDHEEEFPDFILSDPTANKPTVCPAFAPRCLT
jgi:hypothetical protein